MDRHTIFHAAFDVLIVAKITTQLFIFAISAKLIFSVIKRSFRSNRMSHDDPDKSVAEDFPYVSRYLQIFANFEKLKSLI